MQLGANQAATDPELTMSNTHGESISENNWKKPSESAIKSIEITQSTIKNEQLATSLQRLAETLKKAT